MIKFINNIGDYFSSNYFDEDFGKKVADKSGYANEDLKSLQKRVSGVKEKYFRFKQTLLEGKLRTRDKVNETHRYHTEILNALGYEGNKAEYSELFHVDDKTVLPIRHTLYRGEQSHLMIMEMQSLIKEGDEEPDGLFEQRYNVEDEETQTPPQKYHRSQWSDLFTVPEGLRISPIVINKVVSQLFLLEPHRRPKYILLCAGNMYYLLEQEKWFRGSYLEFDLESLFDEASIKKEYYSLFYLLLSKEMLAPQAEIVLMEQLDEDSHKSAYEVTQDLKEGVIHAVESIANEAVYALKQQGHSLEAIDANVLKNECLNYVYRLLFLFYAESREDLDILPANDETYLKGYSLEMLRDLEQVPLNTASSQNGYFFHESLTRLFALLSSGYREKDGDNRSFKIRHLDSPLFNDSALSILPKVKLRNVIWQDVICQLSLSKKQKGKNRGRISYANLGINQLGSVYESLLAFRGFFAETDYIEVHRKRNANEISQKVVNSDGSYLVPRHRIDDFDPLEVYRDKQDDVRIIPRGTFIYRLSGRDRQKSASYYTPEVLTECTVKYTLKPILERLDMGEMKALDLLDLKILEPAMGAAAFHNEVINQLAEAYLQYRQKELVTKVAPDKYREETQKVKAYIALNNVYGVDLNPTAVELGKLSLWLNVIHKDMQTPFFGYRLGTGNAVVGAWLKAYPAKDFLFDKKAKKEWWNKAPKHLGFKSKGIQRKEDEIYHFLLPDKNMVPSAGIKLLKDEFPNEAKRVADWKKDFCAPISASELPILKRLSTGIDRLLEEHYLHQRKINQLTSGKVSLFGIDSPELSLESYQEKERLAAQRLKTNAPYFKLKMVMDYWCSLWFWDMRDAADLPTRREWWHDLANILEVDLSKNEEHEQAPEAKTVELKAKNLFERETQLSLLDGQVTEVAEAIIEYGERNSTQLFQTNRLKLVKKHAQTYRFFHYQLEFIEVFKERGGFDVVVGNPPWDQVEFDKEGYLSEKDPLLAIRKAFDLHFEIDESYLSEEIFAESSKSFFRNKVCYPLNTSSKSNLYKLFYEQAAGLGCYIGLVHDRGIFSDSKGVGLRKIAYESLKYLFRFNNELKLFSEVGNAKKFEVSILKTSDKSRIEFISISNLFHPKTIDLCFTNCQNDTLNIRNENNDWELRGNNDRLLRIDDKELGFISEYFDDKRSKSPILPYFHSKNQFKILKQISSYPNKVSGVSDKIFATQMLNEHEAQKDKLIIKSPGSYDLEEFVLNGANIYPGNPIFQTPNLSAKNHRDYSVIDVQYIEDDFLPFSVYKVINRDKIRFPKKYYHAHRRRAINTNERTFIPAIIPPKVIHVRSCYSLDFESLDEMLIFSTSSISLLFDFMMRSTGKEDFVLNVVSGLPLIQEYKSDIIIRGVILNSVTEHYSDLWRYTYNNYSNFNELAIINHRLPSIHKINSKWESVKDFRSPFSRRYLAVEIDVLVAMAIGLNLKELISVYKGDFSVLRQNEDDTWYDTTGNIVFTCSKGLTGVGVDRPVWESIRDMKAGETYEHTIEKSELYYGKKAIYYAPFDKCDRVEDYKVAWAHFEKIFKDK